MFVAHSGEDSEMSIEELGLSPNLVDLLKNKWGIKELYPPQKKALPTAQVFVSKQPRGAALKAATRGHTDIQLRERGTNRVHSFKGWTEVVAKPANGPAWLPDKIKKANVSKNGITRL